jgi:hypothetical protein
MMTAGSVTVAGDGQVTKTDMAEALYDALILGLGDTVPPSSLPSGPAGVPAKRGLASTSTRLAAAIVAYLQANAVASIGAAVGGLQKTPDPNDPNVATAAPGADKTLPIS